VCSFAAVAVSVLQSVAEMVNLFEGRTLDDFECIPSLGKQEIASAFSVSNGVLRIVGETDALLRISDKALSSRQSADMLQKYYTDKTP
jgi:hypothetical protein